MPKVYLCGPLSGHTMEYARGWRDHATMRFRRHMIDVLSPLRGLPADYSQRKVDELENEHMLALPEFYFERDRNDVLNRADAVFCNLLDAKKISPGSMIELGWANSRGIPIVLVVEPHNVHQCGFLRRITPLQFVTLDAGIDAAIALF